ncbi:MAG: hypothetical protein JNL28_09465 [Planctomycetes bacterium]|nr:hypothetical protein [Planctomycetota bacterium]
MPSLIAHWPQADQRALLDDLNYLNLAEMRTFCRAHAIPYAICVETKTGELRKTADTDRKSVVLARVRRYLKTGRVPQATCFPAHIVREDALPKRLTPSDRLYYGHYEKHNPVMINLLKRLTDGRFRSGALARILAREFWSAGKAPTFAEFAAAWSRANPKGLGIADGLHPEAAWLTDRARGTADKNWKARRAQIAARVLKALRTIPRP